jgi:hypothetical protein
MATLTVQQVTTAGLERTTTAAGATGDEFVNDGKTILVVEDTGTTAPTVTIDSQVECDQGFDHDASISVESGETRYIGPFPINRWNDENGKVQVTYSDETDVVVSAISIAQ